MITGRVNAYREAVILLDVLGPTGQTHQVEAVIDTGFDGWLTLPESVITSLGLTWRRRGRAMLADGNDTLFDIYDARVIWDSAPRRVAVDAVDCDPLVGMALLNGYELNIQVIDGGPVTIQPIP